MAKEIIVNCDTRETRVALLDNGKLVELHIEREERVVGSIFKCKVCNVLPGMDAAFVDLGLERAFLRRHVIPMRTMISGPVGGARNLGRLSDEPGTDGASRQGPRELGRQSRRGYLPGRYCVLMPDADNLGVSRRIDAARTAQETSTSRPKGASHCPTEAEGK